MNVRDGAATKLADAVLASTYHPLAVVLGVGDDGGPWSEMVVAGSWRRRPSPLDAREAASLFALVPRGSASCVRLPDHPHVTRLVLEAMADGRVRAGVALRHPIRYHLRGCVEAAAWTVAVTVGSAGTYWALSLAASHA